MRQWWRYYMETLPALLALCRGNLSVTGGFPSQRASDSMVWCFIWCQPDQTGELTFNRQLTWDVLVFIWCHCNVLFLGCIKYQMEATSLESFWITPPNAHLVSQISCYFTIFSIACSGWQTTSKYWNTCRLWGKSSGDPWIPGTMD